jgi:hypothetical protein
MRFPWQKTSAEAETPSTPATASTTSPPEKSAESQVPEDDGERRIIPVAEDEKLSSSNSAEAAEATEQGVAQIDQSTNAPEKEPEADLVLTASRATEASSVGEAGEDDESKYPKALPLAVLTFGLCLSTFVVALDNTIIGTLLRQQLSYSTTDRSMQQLPYRKSLQSSTR